MDDNTIRLIVTAFVIMLILACCLLGNMAREKGK